MACGSSQRLPPATGADQELNRCLKLASKKKYKESVDCLEVFKSRYPAGNQAAEADLLIGDNYFRQKEYLLAAETYQEFLRAYPSHPKADYAYYKSAQAYLKETPKSIDRDQEHLEAAVQNFEMLRHLSNSPYQKLAEEEYRAAKLKQARVHFYVGRFYYKYGEYLAAIPRFAAILNEYAGLGLDEQSFYYLIDASAKTNQNEQAQKALDAFERHYPKSRWLKKARSSVKASSQTSS